MTKADFLQLLERALAQLPEEERRANLEYYSELLDDMLEEGMTEAEATAKLGSPSQIAQSILQEVPLGKLVSTRMKPKSGWTPLAIVLAVVGSPVWVPLLLLAAALVLSLFVSIWALGVAAVQLQREKTLPRQGDGVRPLRQRTNVRRAGLPGGRVLSRNRPS